MEGSPRLERPVQREFLVCYIARRLHSHLTADGPPNIRRLTTPTYKAPTLFVFLRNWLQKMIARSVDRLKIWRMSIAHYINPESTSFTELYKNRRGIRWQRGGSLPLEADIAWEVLGCHVRASVVKCSEEHFFGFMIRLNHGSSAEQMFDFSKTAQVSN